MFVITKKYRYYCHEKSIIYSGGTMDPGLGGRTVIVCASSKDLVLACAPPLAPAWCRVLTSERAAIQRADGLSEAHITMESGSVESGGGVPRTGHRQRSRPAPGSFVRPNHAAWSATIELKILAPFHVAGWYALATIRVDPRYNLGDCESDVFDPRAFSGARAGLIAAAKTLSRALAANNVSINNLVLDTDRQKSGRA
ncbi:MULTISPECIES: hypothetical protein [unclassified Bradyrhizobium]|uniref:hypothetical protein n=1 Tax=unclassified Bradyrhizobium TaxID=2631580 RepID=UPI0033945D97